MRKAISCSGAMLLKRSFWIFLVFLMQTLHSSGVPQELASFQDSIPTFQINKVVITADRMANKVFNTTSSVTAISAEEIHRLPVMTLSDAINYVPGFFVFNKDGLGRNPIVNTRGFFGGGEAEYIQVLLDGQQLNDLETGLINWNLIPLDNIASVEILRGPSSALYGDAALGGVVNILTRKDRAAPSSLSLSGGSFGGLGFNINALGSVLENPYKFSAAHEKTNGFRTHGSWRGSTFGGDVTLDAGKSTSLRFSTINQWSEKEDPGPISVDELNSGRNGSDSYYKNDGTTQRRNQIRAEINSDVKEASQINAAISYTNRRSIIIRTFTAPAFILNPQNGSILGMYDTTMYGDTKERELHTDEIGLNLSYTFSGFLGQKPNRLTLGYDGLYGRYTTDYFAMFSGFDKDYREAGILRVGRVSGGEGEKLKNALYVNNELQLLGSVTLNLGMRYDRFHHTYNGTLKDTGFKADNERLSPKFGANIRLAANPGYKGNVYFTASSAFKAPTIDQMFDQRQTNSGIFIPAGEEGTYVFSPITAQPFSNAFLKPQKVTNYEIGTYQWFKILQTLYGEFTLSVYRMDISDEIDFDLKTLRYQNIQKSRHQGWELGLMGYWLQNVDVFFNYTFSDVTFRSGPSAGNYLKSIPRNVLQAGAIYKHSAGVSLSLAWNIVRDIYLDDENTSSLPNYSTGSLKLSYTASHYNFYIQSNNILDNRFSSVGYISYGKTFVYPSAGRTYQGGINVSL